jgi:hypothetical protein
MTCMDPSQNIYQILSTEFKKKILSTEGANDLSGRRTSGRVCYHPDAAVVPLMDAPVRRRWNESPLCG